jgi:hypothetical protein
VSTILSGNVSSGSGIIRGDVINSDLSGYTSAEVSFGSSGDVSGIFTGTYTRYPKPHVDYFYKTEAYSERVVNGTLSGTYVGSLDGNLSGTLSGFAAGDLSYFVDTSTNDYEGPNWKIAPKVGDFFRLDFHDDNHEEYEITELIDRNLQIDGINPLLQKYVWRMACVRRDPSYEDVIGTDGNLNPDIPGGGGEKEEEFTRNKFESNEWIEDASNDILDYSSTYIDGELNCDDIYGSYNLP